MIEVIDNFFKEKTSSDSYSGVPESFKVETDVNDKFYELSSINSVCNLPVSMKNPKHSIEHAGEKVYFYCDGSKVCFEINPGKYIKV